MTNLLPDASTLVDDITQINKKKRLDAAAAVQEMQRSREPINLQETIINAFQILINFLDQHVTSAEVTNMPAAIHTPDVAEVVKAVAGVQQQLSTHENTDVAPIVTVLHDLLQEAKALPKAFPDIHIPEQQVIDYSKQFDRLENALELIKKTIDAQKLNVEAPKVNVSAPAVHVEAPAPDLSRIEDIHREVIGAIEGIDIPAPASLSKVEGLIKKTNGLINEFLDNMPVGGGGGGGRATPYEDDNSIPLFVQLNKDGSVPSDVSAHAVRIDDSTTPGMVYIGKAPVGADTAAQVWQIAKLDTSSGLIKTWAVGSDSFGNIWDSRESLSYS